MAAATTKTRDGTTSAAMTEEEEYERWKGADP
jgi:hypothetical protein